MSASAGAQRVLVAGIGNVFLGDDGFGVEVAHRLVAQRFPEGVEVADYGIRGVHLAYQLLDGYDALVLVDAVPMGEPPGTLAVIRPDAVDGAGAFDSHTMSPGAVLGVLETLGGSVGTVSVVGCEPATVQPGMTLSPPVAAAVDAACELVREVVGEMVGSVRAGEADRA